jgi:transcriptional regulator with XRE-family HTH domain
METYGIEQSIGELIRQTRRQNNLTQTELGGARYSKSYVSAVERSKITPSSEALQFFAERLNQTEDYFITFSQQAEHIRQLAVLHGSNTLGIASQALQDEELTFLDIMLDSADHYHFEALHELPVLPAEVIAALPQVKQARYYFLRGMIAQKRQDYSAALQAFENALTFTPAKHQSAILDELGHTYYLSRSFHIALNYHLRALDLLQFELSSHDGTALQFKVELHCGDDYLALGAYKEACDYFECARSHLNAERDMKTAGLLYLSLGYCTYALIWQSIRQATSDHKGPTPEEMEIQFQRAMSFLVQSRSVCQVSYDRMGEARARLALALAELEMSTQKRHLTQQKNQGEGKEFVATYASLLNDAEEQCRQVLLAFQEPPGNSDTPTASLDSIIYLAMAYLVRIFVQRAMLARLGGYGDTSYRERALASFICLQVFDTFYESSFPISLISGVLYLQADTLAYRASALPSLPDSGNAKKVLRSPISQVEVYFAAGELAEELGRSAKTPDYALDCYTRANQFLQAALNLAHSVVSMGDRDPGYLVHCYQRCIGLLEERSTASPELWEETARTMVNLFKGGLYQLQDTVLSAYVRS